MELTNIRRDKIKKLMEAPILIVPLVIFLFSTILPFYQGEGVETSLILQEPIGLGGISGTLFLITFMGLLGTKFYHIKSPVFLALGKGLYVSYATLALLMLVQAVLMNGAPMFGAGSTATPGIGMVLGFVGVALSYGALIYLVGLPYIKAIREEVHQASQKR